jgi:hypothetical protein
MVMGGKLLPGRIGGMADAEHSKCFVRKGVWVQIPHPAPDFISLSPGFFGAKDPQDGCFSGEENVV